MKKFFSLIAAVLFAGSMMAADATMAAGTNGSACTVNGAAGIKCGTSKAAGDMTITVGAGATQLTVYAAAWKGVNGASIAITAPTGVTANPASLAITADDGISNNTPFTLAGTEANFKFEIALTGVEAETTLTLSCAKRFVVWNATYTTGGETPVDPQPVVVAPYCETEVGHFFAENADPNSFVLLSIGSKNGKTIVRIDQDAAKNTQMFDYLQVTGLATDGEDVAEGGVTAMAVEFDTPAAVEDSITLEILWSTVNWPGRWMVQNVKVPAAATCDAAVLVPAPVAGPTNCAEAAEAALSVSANNELYNNGAEYTITGYVTSIQTAYNSQYSNITFWMADAANGGNVIEAYRAACASADDAPIVGDKVTVTGSLTKYNSTPEFAAGCTYVIVEHATPVVPVNLGEKTIAEFIALANTVDTCVITGTVANIKTNTDGSYNKYGNFDLVDGEASVYVYGLLTAEGQAQQFQSMGIDEGDVLTVKAVYSLYNNAVQAKNAVFVKVVKTGTAIDNTNVEAKAVKFFENGQLIILKNGVKYNAQGAIVK